MRQPILVLSALLFLALQLSAAAFNNGQTDRSRYASDLIKVKLAPEAIDSANLPQGLYAETTHFNVNELDQLMSVNGGLKIIRAHRRVKDTEWETKTGFDRWFLIKLDGRVSVDDALKAFKQNRYVEEAIPEYYAYTTAIPNDTYYANNWGHNNTAQLPVYTGGSHSGAGVGTIGFDVDAQLAWDQSQGYGSSGIIIAVIDTGVDTTHPDLRLVAGYDYGDNDSNPMDNSADPGHGTACSGVAAGKANNGIGVTGIAGGCSVMPLKIADSAGNLGFTAIENALTHAGDNYVDVASMSFGAEGGMAEGDAPSTDAALEYAYSQGVTLLAATANSNTSTIAYPSNHNKVISVGAATPCAQRKSATSCDGETWWGSNYGTNVQDAKESVDIMAPTILPATDLVSGGYSSTSYYLWFNGTSCATPYAAGVAALLLSKDQNLTPSQVRTALTSTATDMTSDGGAGWDRYTGYGLVNANAALNSLIPGMPSCQITTPASGTMYNLGATIVINVTATDSDGTITGVAFYIDDATTPSYTDNSSPYFWNWNTAGSTGGSHSIKAVATDNNGNTAQSTVFVALLAPADEGFETGNFNSYPWMQGGALPWTMQNTEVYSGSYAARSGAITDSQSSEMSVTLNITAAGNISFFQKISSEANYDFLRFYIDDALQGSWSGTGAWDMASYTVGTGSHTFKWSYSKDVSWSSGSDCAWVDHIDFPAHTVPSAYYPPQNLTAVGASGVVYLTWQAPAYGAPTGYKIYRNSSLLTTVTGLSYNDYAVANGTTYAYYLKAVYTGGESDPTPTVYATPNVISSVIIGSGTSSNSTTTACPINVYYESLHGQAVYTAAELNAAGVYGPVEITQIGFNVTGLPTLAMPNYLVRMKHTTATNVYDWQTAAGMVNVWNSASYQPTATGWNMLTLSIPFTWNGMDNIVIDTAFGDIGAWTQSGTTQYTSVTNGYRYVRNDDSDQTNVFTGGSTSIYRPNVKLTFLVEEPAAPEINVSHTSIGFGAVAVGSTSVEQFVIQNLGDAVLTGTITTPTGYSVAEVTRAESSDVLARKSLMERNTISLSVPAGTDKLYNLTFAPSAVTSYNGNLVITSNDADEPIVNIALTGSGFIPPTISIDSNALSASLEIGAESTDSFTISNSGSQNLTYTITESPAVAWFSASPSSGSVGGGGSQLITGSFSADGLAPGSYQTTLLLASNDPQNPELTLSVDLTVLNNAPTIVLPDSFSFDMNGSLVVDFSPFAGDPDGQTLTLGYSGNTNVLVAINGMSATLTATADWYGSEELTFSVYDGYAYAYDTALVTVNFVNTAPTIVLPDSFSFDMNGSLVVDFTTLVNDVDGQTLTLGYSGNTNVLVAIDGLTATFTATEDWFGSEELTFSVFDGYDYAYDTALVTVSFVNTAPTIQLPDSFSFDLNGSLVVDFSTFVSDPDNQTLAIAYTGNSNIQVSVTGMLVTLSSSLDWFGSESITFSVYDGYDFAYDTVAVNVLLNYLAAPAISDIFTTANGIMIQWEPVPNATAYQIYRCSEPFGVYTLIGSSSVPEFEDTDNADMAFYKIVALHIPPAK